MSDERRVLSQAALVALCLFALGVGLFLGADSFHVPEPVPEEAPATAFSAERAMEHVRVLSVAPRPQGSDAAEAAREWIVDELRALGLEPRVQEAPVVRSYPGTDMVSGARTLNVVARIDGRLEGDGVLLSAHYDSGPNALGAGDCASCVAVVLETARALLAGPPPARDVLLVFVDGEETGLFGSRLFARQHPWAEEVGVVLNFEAQGVTGPSVLYVTSPGDARLAGRILEASPQPSSWSWLSFVVREVVGGSDLDSYVEVGMPGAGFAFFGEPQHYHTLLDSPAMLDPGSVQHQGEQALAATRALAEAGPETLEAEADAIWVTVARGAVVQYPSGWALPLAALATLMLGGVLGWARQREELALGRSALGALLWAGTAGLALVLVTGAWALVRIVDPDLHLFLVGISYQASAYVAGFALLAVAGLTGVALWGTHHLGRAPLAAGALLAWWPLMVGAAVLMPVASPQLTWPLLAATGAFALVGAAAEPARWRQAAGFVLAAIPALALLVPAVRLMHLLAGRMEALSGLPMMALPVGVVVLASVLLLPLVPRIEVARRWEPTALLAAVAVVLLIGASVGSSFDAENPRTSTVLYDLDADEDSATWATTADPRFGRGRTGQLDPWTRQFLGETPEPAEVAPWSYAPGFLFDGYRAEAPVLALPAPAVEIVQDRVADDERALTLRITSSRDAPNLRLRLDGSLSDLAVAGEPVPLAQMHAAEGLWVYYLGLDADGLRLDLVLPAGSPLSLALHDWTWGLPGVSPGDRPADVVPALFDLADTTMVRTTWQLEPREGEVAER